jgi:hypothetical protein
MRRGRTRPGHTAIRLGAPVGVVGAVLAATAGTAGASWAGVPPDQITPPTNYVGVNVFTGDAAGPGEIVGDEIDWFTFVAPVSGSYGFSASTPGSSLDTVLGVFDGTGARRAFNDDISATNSDSSVRLNLNQGTQYFFGITNVTGTPGGAYSWAVDRPK